jgi:hypothetical protein
MWLAHSGQCVQVFAGHDGPVVCGGFSQDGTRGVHVCVWVCVRLLTHVCVRANREVGVVWW